MPKRLRRNIGRRRDIGSGAVGDAELFHSGLERRPFHAKAGSGPGESPDHPMGFLQRPQDMLTLRGFQGDHPVGYSRGLRFQFPKRHPQLGSLRQDHGTFDQIFELPDVAWPGVVAEGRQGLRGYRLDRLAMRRAWCCAK